MTRWKIVEETDDELVLLGPVALYGGKDLTGEYFSPETDFDSDYVRAKAVLVDWEHGRKPDPDEVDGKATNQPGRHDILGKVDVESLLNDPEYGLLAKYTLDRRKKYVRRFVEPLAKANLLATSSETIPGLEKRAEDGHLTKWPLKRVGFTVEPCEPRNMSEAQLEVAKSLADYIPEFKSLAIGDQDIAGKEQAPDDDKQGKSIMEDTNFITRDEAIREFDEIKEQLKSLASGSEKVDALLDRLEKSPAAKKTGQAAPDSELDNAGTKSFGDFLLAVRNKNTKRIKSVYATKDMSSLDGGSGGYLVPDDYSTALLDVMEKGNPITSRCFNQPVMRRQGSYPILDTFITPTAGSGQTALAAGVKPTSVNEGAAYPEQSDPGFELLQYNVKKLGDVVDVPEELIEDSGVVIEALLRRLFQLSIDSLAERHVLRGSGGSEFLGILNSSAAVAITPASDNAFGEADALTMVSRFKPIFNGSPAWLMHRSVIPDFVNFTSSGTDLVEWRDNVPSSLLGYPILYSEHLPQANNSGNVILADLGAYIIFNRRQLTIRFSEHAKFENDLVTWKFNIRADGMPWLKSAITLADPQGSYTVSPFVYHND